MKHLFEYIFQILWYDPKTDSTLRRSDWRFHHNGIAMILYGVFYIIEYFIHWTFINPILVPPLFVCVCFLPYKILFEGGGKALKDFKDTISDFSDFLIVFPFALWDYDLTLAFFFIGLIILIYILSSILEWDTP